MGNQDIKRAAGGAGVRLWQVADALRITDSALSRKLRKKLPDDEREEILSIIKQLSREAV